MQAYVRTAKQKQVKRPPPLQRGTRTNSGRVSNFPIITRLTQRNVNPGTDNYVRSIRFHNISIKLLESRKQGSAERCTVAHNFSNYRSRFPYYFKVYSSLRKYRAQPIRALKGGEEGRSGTRVGRERTGASGSDRVLRRKPESFYPTETRHPPPTNCDPFRII